MTKHTRVATLHTNHGAIKVNLFGNHAPKTVENFIGLADGSKDWTHPRTGAKHTGTPLYQGVIFHRIIPGFMIQGGDPTGTGMGGSKLPDIKAEFSDEPHIRGAVSMARASDPNSANSQFFIVTKDSRFLDNQYTVFGRVIKGMEFVDKIKKGDGANGKVSNPDAMLKVRVASDEK